ncbi:MAG: sulfatase-like hydrolase/transferase [Planctomycetes bacterium]|nr:sulfatase-like hydrolase/transferase [Planctomycetota bacterium]
MPRLILHVFAAFLFAICTTGYAAPKRPSFVVILCDDLGFGDLECFGHPHIRTPSLNRLAERGIRLTSCYSSAPVCSSSRAGLLTGRAPSRVGVYDWIPNNHVVHLRKEEVTVATLLRRAGYSTAHVGKWHCNGKFNQAAQPQPGDHGFEHWYSTQNNASPTHENPINFVRNGKPVGPQEGFSCQLVADESIRWLENGRDKDKPFFLFTCFHEPHEPVASPRDLVDSYQKVAENEDQAQYFANVTNMDKAVGRIVRKLDDLGLSDTLVIFTSDNGPETLKRYRGAGRSYGSPGDLRGMKLWMYEAGIRVPGIICWPDRIKAGQVVDEPVCGLDILPTLCEMAKVTPPKDRAYDGASVTAILNGTELKRPRPLYWHYYRALGVPKAAMRVGDWMILGHRSAGPQTPGRNVDAKSMALIAQETLSKFELYNVKTDLAQKQDQAKSEPEKLVELKAQLIARHKEVRDEGVKWKFPPR